MKREVVGEGGYGCVLKPSIHCKTSPKPGFNYDGYVSKIMETVDATTELQEFETIGRLDPTNQYHLGKPILCRPKLDEPNVKKNIGKCKYIKIDDIVSKPSNYSLLVLKDGGPDLKSLCLNHLEKYLASNKLIKTDKFWLEVHHLIKGLQFFKDSGVIHYDIKPQNILFDLKDGSLKYIDFGLMKLKSRVIVASKINKNSSSIFHWSYPFDCGFMNKKQFEQYKNSKNRSLFKTELSEMIIEDSKINSLKLHIKNPQAFTVIFSYLNPDGTVPDASTQYAYISSFFDGFNTLLSEKTYDQILEIFVDSMDVYGLGFTLQYIANCFKRHDALSLEEFTTLSTFFNKMYDFNPSTRVINIDDLLNEYENVLLQNGVLTRLNKSFENHVLIDKEPMPSIRSVKIKSRQRQEHLSPELQAFANLDPIDLNNKCKHGFVRNKKFKCRKYKTKKTVNINSRRNSNSNTNSRRKTKSKSRK